MKIKSYQEFTNEELDWKKGLATAALGASLAFSNPAFSKGQDSINNIEIVSNKNQNKNDTILTSIINEIKLNINSTDSTKYIELFDKLSSHLSSKYGYEIVKKDISINEESVKELSIFEIMGWLGSICLAICGLPQAWMSYRDKHSHGISWGFVLLWAFGEAFALAYVYDKLDLPLVVNYLTNILIVGIILYYKINPSKEKTGNEPRLGH